MLVPKCPPPGPRKVEQAPSPDLDSASFPVREKNGGFRIQRAASLRVPQDLIDHVQDEFPDTDIELQRLPNLRIVSAKETGKIIKESDIFGRMPRTEVIHKVLEAVAYNPGVQLNTLGIDSRPFQNGIRLELPLDDARGKISTARNAYLEELANLANVTVPPMPYEPEVRIGVIKGPNFQSAAAEFVTGLTVELPDIIYLHPAHLSKHQ
jgi:hypothetical protein